MKVCLRCDWEGDTRAKACPRCGAALYVRRAAAASPGRPRRRERRRRERLARTPRHARQADPRRRAEPAAEPAGEREHRRRTAVPSWLPAALVLVVVASVFTVVQRHMPTPSPTRSATGLSGTLAYTTQDQLGGWHLERWDLAADTVRDGPNLPTTPIQLVDLRFTGSATLGATVGDQRAQGAMVIGSLLPEMSPTYVAKGQLIAWIPDSLNAMSASIVTPAHGCAHLMVFTSFGSGGAGRRFSDLPVCATLVAFARTLEGPFATLATHDGFISANVQRTSLGDTIGGWTIVGAGRSRSLLVARPEAGTLSSVLALWTPEGGSPSLYGIGLQHLTFEALVGWTPANTAAYVLGTFQGNRGVYLAPLDGSHAPWEPVLMAPVADRAEVRVTETADGGPLIVAIGASFFLARDGGLTPIALPAGAPMPAGPILWMGDSTP